MTAVAVQLFPDDDEIVLRGVRFPVELRPSGADPSDPASWPVVVGRIEYVGGKLLYMPLCDDTQSYVTTDVTFVLRSWSSEHPGFVVGGNEAGMKLRDDTRAADAAVWRRADVGLPSGRLQHVPPVLAVEVAGQDEEEPTLRTKAAWYLSHGVEVVWLVLPDTREVIVLTTLGEGRYAASASERIAPHDALPGLSPEVTRFFAQLDGT